MRWSFCRQENISSGLLSSVRSICGVLSSAVYETWQQRVLCQTPLHDKIYSGFSPTASQADRVGVQLLPLCDPSGGRSQQSRGSGSTQHSGPPCFLSRKRTAKNAPVQDLKSAESRFLIRTASNTAISTYTGTTNFDCHICTATM